VRSTAPPSQLARRTRTVVDYCTLAHATRTRPTNPLRDIAGGDALVDLIMVRFLAAVGGAVGGKLLMARSVSAFLRCTRAIAYLDAEPAD
jgi:hypothetical protein